MRTLWYKGEKGFPAFSRYLVKGNDLQSEWFAFKDSLFHEKCLQMGDTREVQSARFCKHFITSLFQSTWLHKLLYFTYCKNSNNSIHNMKNPCLFHNSMNCVLRWELQERGAVSLGEREMIRLGGNIKVGQHLLLQTKSQHLLGK